jgi:hypothetical protein
MRRLLIVLAGVVLLLLGLAVPAGASGDSGTLPAGSTACTDRVLSSSGAFIRGRADNVPATFTTRISTTPGGPETTIFTQVTREVAIHFPGNDYPTYRLLITPPTPGTYYFRNCVTATHGSDYRFRLAVEGNGQFDSDIGPHTATLAPGGRHCGDWLSGPSIGLGDGAARLIGSASAPVTFSLSATDSDYGFLGDVFLVTGAAVNEVYLPPSYISSTSACATNTSNTTVTVSFELDPA